MRSRAMYLVAVQFRSTRSLASSLPCAVLLFLAIPGCRPAFAQLFGSSNIGAQEFIGIDLVAAARSSGLAGACVAQGDGTGAIGINPAGLVRETGQDFTGTIRYHPDAANAGLVAYSRPLGSDGRLAFSASYLNYGTIPGRDENDQPIGDLAPFSFYPAVTYARSAGSRWRWGASLKMALEDPGKFDGAQKAVAMGADAGFQYQAARNVGIGVSVVNVGRELRGYSHDGTASSGSLPGAFKAGAFLHPRGLERMSIELDAEAPFYEVPALALGYEYRVMSEWDVRAGTRWDSNDIRNLLGWLGATGNAEHYGSALKAATGTTLRTGHADVDYALQWWSDLGIVHALTLSWRVD